MHGRRRVSLHRGLFWSGNGYRRRSNISEEVDVARIQVLVYPNVRITKSIALDADGVRFSVQISVEYGIGESKTTIWPMISRPTKISLEKEERQADATVPVSGGTNRGVLDLHLRNGDLLANDGGVFSGVEGWFRRNKCKSVGVGEEI